MKRPGFFDLIAACVGMIGSVVAVRYLFGIWSERPDLWFLVASGLSSCIVCRCFRKTIVFTKGWLTIIVAVGLGIINALLFPTIWLPIMGLFFAFPTMIMSLPVIAPVSLFSFFAVRWADSHDRNSLRSGSQEQALA